MTFNRQSQIENPQSFWFSDIYIQEVKAQRFKASFYLDHSFPIAAVPICTGTAGYWKSK